MLGYTLIKRYGKTSDKNGQLMFCNIAAKRVETRCCAFYRLQFKPVLLQIMLLQIAWILRLLFRSLQEPDLFSEGRFDSWVVNAQHRYSTLFSAMLQNKLKVFAALLYRSLKTHVTYSSQLHHQLWLLQYDQHVSNELYATCCRLVWRSLSPTLLPLFRIWKKTKSMFQPKATCRAKVEHT